MGPDPIPMPLICHSVHAHFLVCVSLVTRHGTHFDHWPGQVTLSFCTTSVHSFYLQLKEKKAYQIGNS